MFMLAGRAQTHVVVSRVCADPHKCAAHAQCTLDLTYCIHTFHTHTRTYIPAGRAHTHASVRYICNAHLILHITYFEHTHTHTHIPTHTHTHTYLHTHTHTHMYMSAGRALMLLMPSEKAMVGQLEDAKVCVPLQDHAFFLRNKRVISS